MKACILGKENIGLPGIRFVELPDPLFGSEEVLIRMHATSLNYRDHLIVTNNYATAALDEDLILLSDGAGEVVAVGGDVTRFQVGRVYPFAETVDAFRHLASGSLVGKIVISV